MGVVRIDISFVNSHESAFQWTQRQLTAENITVSPPNSVSRSFFTCVYTTGDMTFKINWITNLLKT